MSKKMVRFGDMPKTHTFEEFQAAVIAHHKALNAVRAKKTTVKQTA